MHQEIFFAKISKVFIRYILPYAGAVVRIRIRRPVIRIDVREACIRTIVRVTTEEHTTKRFLRWYSSIIIIPEVIRISGYVANNFTIFASDDIFAESISLVIYGNGATASISVLVRM